MSNTCCLKKSSSKVAVEENLKHLKQKCIQEKIQHQKSLDFFFNSCFHISHIDEKTVVDYGFFTAGEKSEHLIKSEEWIDDALEEGVIDISTFGGDYSVGFGPNSVKKLQKNFSMEFSILQ